jgi:ribosomal-protein-alanine N-acetyltransferase
LTLIIRPIEPSDVEEVIRIEEACFLKPWDNDVFRILATWQGEVRIEDRRTILMRIAEADEKIAGYIVWEENRDTFTAHLMNIVIDSSFRRKGFATMLAIYAFDRMRKQSMKRCILEVRESNRPAIELYKHLGMKHTGRRPDYYEGEDALIFTQSF